MFVSAEDRGGAACSDCFKGLLSDAGGASVVRAVVAIVKERVEARRECVRHFFEGDHEK